MGLLRRGRDTKKSRVQATVVKTIDKKHMQKEVRERIEKGSELHIPPG